ncbi:MAG: hypothetical protein O3A51_08100 [Verrucomicrobia bacterium]|nr:hypothetical protein [Verrucomicrobiota bacterium]
MRTGTTIERFLVSATLIMVVFIPAKSPAASPKDSAKEKSNQGQMVFGGREYKFDHAVAFSMGDRVVRRVVLFSQQPVAITELKRELIESDSDVLFTQPGPHIRLYFNDENKLVSHKIWTPGNLLGKGAEGIQSAFRLVDGHASGTAVMDPPQIGFENKPYHFKIEFHLPVIAVQTSTPPAEGAAPSGPSVKKPAKRDAPAVAGDPLNAYALPLPEDAEDVSFVALVKQIKYSSPSDVETIVEFLSQGLEGMGWKKTGTDLLTAQSSILKRTHGGASLTLFVRADGEGSQVVVMAKGLTWEKKK